MNILGTYLDVHIRVTQERCSNKIAFTIRHRLKSLLWHSGEDVIKGESGDDDDVCVGGWCLRRKSERWEINDVDYVEPPVSLKLELIQVGKTIQS